MKTTFKEFITTGKLGPITLHTPRCHVRQLLGEPQDWGYSKFKNGASLWKYGDLQLGFAHDEVHFIGVYYHHHSGLPQRLNVVGYFPAVQSPLCEVKRHLCIEHIDYQVEPNLSFDSQLCLAVGKNAYLMFDIETNQIDSIQYASPEP